MRHAQYKEHMYTMLDGVVSVSRLKSGEKNSPLLQKAEVRSTSIAAVNHQVAAEVASQDK